MSLYRTSSGGGGGADFLTRDKCAIRVTSIFSFTLPYSFRMSSNGTMGYIINTSKYSRLTVNGSYGNWKLYDLTGDIPEGSMSGLYESPVEVDGVYGWDVSNKNLVYVSFSNYTGGTLNTTLAIE